MQMCTSMPHAINALATTLFPTVFTRSAVCGQHEMEQTRRTNKTTETLPLVLRDTHGRQVRHGDVKHMACGNGFDVDRFELKQNRLCGWECCDSLCETPLASMIKHCMNIREVINMFQFEIQSRKCMPCFVFAMCDPSNWLKGKKVRLFPYSQWLTQLAACR